MREFLAYNEKEGRKKNDYRERCTIELTGEASEDPDDELSRRTYFQLRLRPRDSCRCTLVSNSFLLGYRFEIRISIPIFFSLSRIDDFFVVTSRCNEKSELPHIVYCHYITLTHS